MEVKNLMIGDWVRCRTKLHGECVCRVTDIEGCHDAVWVNNGKVYGRAHETEIEPIPLTPEILEKNGFKLDKEDGWWWLTPKIGITFWEEGDIELEFENTHSSVDIHIKYVHQLQHALKLCGIEKDIKI